MSKTNLNLTIMAVGIAIVPAVYVLSSVLGACCVEHYSKQELLQLSNGLTLLAALGVIAFGYGVMQLLFTDENQESSNGV